MSDNQISRNRVQSALMGSGYKAVGPDALFMKNTDVRVEGAKRYLKIGGLLAAAAATLTLLSGPVEHTWDHVQSGGDAPSGQTFDYIQHGSVGDYSFTNPGDVPMSPGDPTVPGEVNSLTHPDESQTLPGVNRPGEGEGN